MGKQKEVLILGRWIPYFVKNLRGLFFNQKEGVKVLEGWGILKPPSKRHFGGWS